MNGLTRSPNKLALEAGKSPFLDSTYEYGKLIFLPEKYKHEVH